MLRRAQCERARLLGAIVDCGGTTTNQAGCLLCMPAFPAPAFLVTVRTHSGAHIKGALDYVRV